MGKRTYRFPWVSLAAWWVYRILPDRVVAWARIDQLDDLDDHMMDIDHHGPDGWRSLFYAVPAHRVERLRREQIKGILKGKLPGEESGKALSKERENDHD